MVSVVERTSSKGEMGFPGSKAGIIVFSFFSYCFIVVCSAGCFLWEGFAVEEKIKMF